MSSNAYVDTQNAHDMLYMYMTSHVTYVYVTCHICICDVDVTRHVRICDMSHMYM